MRNYQSISGLAAFLAAFGGAACGGVANLAPSSDGGTGGLGGSDGAPQADGGSDSGGSSGGNIGGRADAAPPVMTQRCGTRTCSGVSAMGLALAPCCASESPNACGVANPLNQQCISSVAGTRDPTCMGASILGQMLPGCCRSTGVCGVDVSAIGLGCASVESVSMGGPAAPAVPCGGRPIDASVDAVLDASVTDVLDASVTDVSVVDAVVDAGIDATNVDAVTDAGVDSTNVDVIEVPDVAEDVIPPAEDVSPVDDTSPTDDTSPAEDGGTGDEASPPSP